MATDIGIDREAVAYTAERLRRAILTHSVTPMRQDLCQLEGAGNPWPDYVLHLSEAYGWHPAQTKRFQPTRLDEDRWWRDLAWIAWLRTQNDGQRDAKIIWARAHEVSWWKISQQFGKAERTIIRWYEGGVTRIWWEFRPETGAVDFVRE